MRYGIWAGAVAVSLLAGCASAQAPAATRVAEGFYAAVAAADGAVACAYLTPSAAESLADDGDCASALLDLKLTATPAPARTEIWGDEAQVKLGGDTLFLHRSGQGWRIRAAGCRPMGVRPYQCEIEG
ncbi:hypothetical protein J5X84_32085 [Streptosporangiaceae bacterium NEAU-GS5]|nr:hypothetical protein [Streptosporangiaceae bacterium NEAU-GS5]